MRYVVDETTRAKIIEGTIMVRRGKQGGATSSVEYSPAKLKRIKAQKLRQEKRWTARNGPVTSRILTDDERRERGLDVP